MDASDELARWRDHLAAPAQGEAYDYPLTESVTEPSEARQDPGKRAREREAIAGALHAPWTRALDFGCGVGANFDLFAASPGRSPQAFLLGLDPDRERAGAARGRLAALGLSGAVAAAGREALERAPAPLGFDAIVCCQVLGHTPRAETQAILAALLARLRPAGRLVLAIPVAFPAVREMAFAHGHEPGADLFHCVYPALDPADPGFRQRVEPEAFDRAARRSPPGTLPVRAFAVQALAAPPRLPADLPAPPAGLAAALPQDVDIRTQLYSIHAVSPRSRVPAIGDAVLTVTRPALEGDKA